MADWRPLLGRIIAPLAAGEFMETEKTTILLSTPAATASNLVSSGAALAMADKTLQGSVLVLIQFDVSEEIRLDLLRTIFGARRQEASFKHPTPGYVQYQRPPVVERVEPLVLESGERLDAQIKYYDYGVLSVVFELPFSGDWDTLVRLASRWVWDTDFTSFARRSSSGSWTAPIPHWSNLMRSSGGRAIPLPTVKSRRSLTQRLPMPTG